MEEIVLLNSGGLDSAIIARKLHENDWTVHSLHVNAGALNCQRTETAAWLTAKNYCDSHHVFRLDLGYAPDHYDSRAGSSVSYDEAQEFGIPDGGLHMPGPRNLPILMLSMGVSYAKHLRVPYVCTGFSTKRHDGIAEHLNAASNYGRGLSIKAQIIAPYGYMRTEEALEFCGYSKGDFYWVVSSCSGCDILDKIEV